MHQFLWECNRRDARSWHFVSGFFEFFFGPAFLTLPRLPTSLMRLPLRLPGDGCPFKAFARSFACVPRSLCGVSQRFASRRSVLRRLHRHKEASRNTSRFAVPKLFPLQGRRWRTPQSLSLADCSRPLERTLPFRPRRGWSTGKGLPFIRGSSIPLLTWGFPSRHRRAVKAARVVHLQTLLAALRTAPTPHRGEPRRMKPP